jgi:hypothetical protein
MMKHFSTLLSLFCFLLVASPASAQGEAQKEKLVRELMDITGAAEMGMQVLDSMLAQFEASGMPTDFLDRFRDLAEPDELTELVVPIYVRTFDKKTLRDTISFYKTRSGKALLAGQPLVTQEAMAVGGKWGEELVGKVMKELQAEKSLEKSAEVPSEAPAEAAPDDAAPDDAAPTDAP